MRTSWRCSSCLGRDRVQLASRTRWSPYHCRVARGGWTAGRDPRLSSRPFGSLHEIRHEHIARSGLLRGGTCCVAANDLPTHSCSRSSVSHHGHVEALAWTHNITVHPPKCAEGDPSVLFRFSLQVGLRRSCCFTVLQPCPHEAWSFQLTSSCLLSSTALQSLPRCCLHKQRPL